MSFLDKKQRISAFLELMSEVFALEVQNELCQQLDKMGFFEAPASTKYHGNYPGGLFDHSYHVTKALLILTEKLSLHWDNPRSPYIIGMLHDLCKCDNYVLNASGSYDYAKNLPLTGHGDKSVILAGQMIALTDEEILCIRWHMGAYDDKENWNHLGAAIEKYPNVLYTHTADMIAARVIGI